MKINWKLRFQNKTSLTAIILAMIALVYQVLGLWGVTPGISENQIIEVAGMVINLLCLLGIVVDPTTSGVSDSNQAMEYSTPKRRISNGHSAKLSDQQRLL